MYLELSRRGGKVNIGKYGSTEVDFVTQKEGVLTYYQVTADMTAEETFEREMRPLRSIFNSTRFFVAVVHHQYSHRRKNDGGTEMIKRNDGISEEDICPNQCATLVRA